MTLHGFEMNAMLMFARGCLKDDATAKRRAGERVCSAIGASFLVFPVEVEPSEVLTLASLPAREVGLRGEIHQGVTVGVDQKKGTWRPRGSTAMSARHKPLPPALVQWMCSFSLPE